jgi:methionyl-tRNA formyltransferase
MRLAFMGSPDFAVPTLQALVDAGHQIAAVYCQPPRPAGRGQSTLPCPVHLAALRLGLEVRHPVSLKRDAEARANFAALDLDVAVVAAYGLILPRDMLDTPRLGCWNIHASLLPRWRGASPIQASLLAGDTASGVTIMRMAEGLDTGPMLLAGSVPLTFETTASTLHDTLAALGARLILQALNEQPTPTPQPIEGATYAPKLTREDGQIDWTQSAETLDRRVRALNPWPGTFTHAGDMVLKIHAARPESGEGPPGTLLDDQGLVACGQGALRLLRLQRPGKGALPAEDFLRGHPLPKGSHLA